MFAQFPPIGAGMIINLNSSLAAPEALPQRLPQRKACKIQNKLLDASPPSIRKEADGEREERDN